MQTLRLVSSLSATALSLVSMLFTVPIAQAQDAAAEQIQQCWFNSPDCECLVDGAWGICRQDCESDEDCPQGSTCGAMDVGDNNIINACVPPPYDCGWLTYDGQCQQNSVSYCGSFGPTWIDCSAMAGDNGRPMRCGMVDGFAQCVNNEQCGRESRGPYVTHYTASQRLQEARAEGYSTSNGVVTMWDFGGGGRMYGFYIYHPDC